MEKVLDIAIGKLKPHFDNGKYFNDIEGEEWNFFKADIERNGILQPLLVTGTEEGGYTILSGHQRFRAAKAIRLENVPAIAIDDVENEADILFSTNLARQLNTMERYRLTIHLLERMEDRRETRERNEKGHFTHSGNNSRNGDSLRNRVCEMVPGITTRDVTVFRRIKELPSEVQQEIFKFVEKENPNKKELKEKVNELNAQKRRLKKELHEERKVKIKKREMDEVREYIHVENNPSLSYDARQYDSKRRALLDASIEIPKLVASIFTGTINRAISKMLHREVEALSCILKEEREKLIQRWKKQIFSDELFAAPNFEKGEEES